LILAAAAAAAAARALTRLTARICHHESAERPDCITSGAAACRVLALDGEQRRIHREASL
jgi:hypothetical protein